MNFDLKTTVSALAATALAAVLVLGFNIDIFGQFISPPEAAQPEVKPETQEIMVDRVYDGDTIASGVGTSSESIRLIGIDAPEIDWQASAEPEAECQAWEARDFLKEKVEGKEVKLVGDSLQPDRDEYDRRLAYVYVDGELVNKTLLEEGYVREMTVGEGYDKRDTFKQAEATAREADRGLWAACGTD